MSRGRPVSAHWVQNSRYLPIVSQILLVIPVLVFFPRHFQPHSGAKYNGGGVVIQNKVQYCTALVCIPWSGVSPGQEYPLDYCTAIFLILKGKLNPPLMKKSRVSNQLCLLVYRGTDPRCSYAWKSPRHCSRAYSSGV